MTKRLTLLLSVSAVMFLQAQDVSVITNTVDLYSNSQAVGSARSMGMAGAMGAIGGDITASDVNPAGTGVFITSDLHATLGIVNDKQKTTLNGFGVDTSQKNTDLVQAGGVASFRMLGSKWQFVNVGVNYTNRNVDRFVKTPADRDIHLPISYTDGGGNTVNDALLFDGHVYDRVGNVTKLNLTVGGNYDNRIYVGAGLNMHTVDFDQADVARLSLASDNSYSDYNKQFTPYSELSNGVSLSAGVIGKVANGIRLGLAIESPTWWNIDRAYTEYFYNTANNIDYEVYGESRSLSSPAKLTLSGAFVPNKNLALNIDYTAGISKPKFTNNGAAEDQLNAFFRNNYSGTSDLKIGGEYRLDGLRVRAGYGFASNPIKDVTLRSVNVNESGSVFGDAYLGKRQTLSAGLGYDFKAFYIDAAFSNVSGEYSNPFFAGEYASGRNFNDGINNNDLGIVSATKSNRNTFVLTAGWKF